MESNTTHIKPLSPQKDKKHIILVAEDEEVNFLYLEAVLVGCSVFNCELLHATNGKEAVNICQNRDDIDLILMDIKMPIMTGHEATVIIRAMHPELPIIAQTAYTSDADRKLAIEKGYNAFITKPINKKDLYALLSVYITPSV